MNWEVFEETLGRVQIYYALAYEHEGALIYNGPNRVLADILGVLLVQRSSFLLSLSALFVHAVLLMSFVFQHFLLLAAQVSSYSRPQDSQALILHVPFLPKPSR